MSKNTAPKQVEPSVVTNEQLENSGELNTSRDWIEPENVITLDPELELDDLDEVSIVKKRNCSFFPNIAYVLG